MKRVMKTNISRAEPRTHFLYSELIEKIKSRQAKIGIIGLGYVGLPLGIEFCKAAFEVIAFDIDEKKVVMLKEGKSYIKHIDGGEIVNCLSKFTPTSDFSRLKEVDCIIICVPTPLNRHREPDMTYVFNTGRAKTFKRGAACRA
jgi:UDP-N-acetyl-D-glucosamine dehydrogenase